MSPLWYNITSDVMKKEYLYYIKIIKPIEKKYTKMCILYSIFKFKVFKNKMNFYNKILINYYKKLQNNYKNLEKMEKYIK